MCGITGFVGKGALGDLERMLATIKHRGPDDSGLFIRRERVGLAHARLSVLDRSLAGRQPMANSTQTIHIIFNGEIYNFQQLKQHLLDVGGVAFHSGTDTEVILRLYERYGEDCFSQLRGMFALAIYDARTEKLLLARDHFGKKPLYWGIHEGTFLFGSELSSLCAHPSFKKEVDIGSVNAYLSLAYVPTPKSIFKNVHKLEPATYLVYQHGVSQKKMFWEPTHGRFTGSFSDAVSVLDQNLEHAVHRRLISDAPLGIFLSGGLDSSTVAYFAQRLSTPKLKTFSIGFEEKSFDESSYARDVSHFLGTDHSEEILSARGVATMIPGILEHLDEPLADPSFIPTFLLSAFAKHSITVALGGDGGDELFAGYQTFQAEKLVALYRAIPAFLRNQLVNGLLRVFPSRDTHLSFSFVLRTFVNGYSPHIYTRHTQWLGSFSQDERAQLFLPDVWHALRERGDTTAYAMPTPEIRISDPQNQLLYFYLRSYLMDQVLVKVDRASMAHGLEVRSPFLDKELVEFAFSLPYTWKLHGFTSKFILKKLMANKLPAHIVQRSKKGFGIPLASWLKTDLREFTTETLSKKSICTSGLFDYVYVKQLQQEHFSGIADHSKKLWTLLVFQVWLQKWYRIT